MNTRHSDEVRTWYKRARHRRNPFSPENPNIRSTSDLETLTQIPTFFSKSTHPTAILELVQLNLFRGIHYRPYGRINSANSANVDRLRHFRSSIPLP